MELLVPATSKNDCHGNRVDVQNEKLKKMMRNHHFTFGTDRASFCSTNEANFITHNIKSEPNNISSLTRSKSFSSVPLNVVNQTGVLKIKSVVDPNVAKIKNLSAFTHSSQKCIKDHRNIIFNPKKTLKDDYQSMTSTTLATINNNEKSNFIKRLSQQNTKDQFDSLKMSSFNIGNPKILALPISASKETFKDHKGNYVISGVYKTGFRAKNKKSSICFKL